MRPAELLEPDACQRFADPLLANTHDEALRFQSKFEVLIGRQMRP
jgi:hypothetical protein